MRYLVTLLNGKEDIRYSHCETPEEAHKAVLEFQKVGAGKVYVQNMFLNVDETFTFVNPEKRYWAFQ